MMIHIKEIKKNQGIKIEQEVFNKASNLVY